MSTNNTSRVKEEKKGSHDAMHLFYFFLPYSNFSPVITGPSNFEF